MRVVRLCAAAALAAAVLIACARGSSRLRANAAEWVEVEGWAPEEPGKLEQARRRALADAQRRAVERVGGVAVSATTKVEADVTYEQRILAEVAGYIRRYEVLSESSEAGLRKVRIRALVAATRADGLDDIVAGFIALPEQVRPKRVAILPFPYIDGRESQGPRLVQEELTNRLVAWGQDQVVAPGETADAALLQKGMLQPQTVASLGRTLRVDAVMTGTLIEHPGGRVQLLARLFHAPDGVVLLASEGSVNRSWPSAPAPDEPGGLGAWLKDLFGPGTRTFHPDGDIDKFVRSRMASLRQAAAEAATQARREEVDTGGDPALLTGRWLFERDCRSCHGPGGQGSPAMAATLGLPLSRLDITRSQAGCSAPRDLPAAVDAREEPMTKLAASLSGADRSALIAYVRRLAACAPGGD